MTGAGAATQDHPNDRSLGRALVAVALVGAVVGSLGAPLITSVATATGVSLGAAQWTLTITLFTGAIAGPVLGRLGTGPHRRATILAMLAVVALGGVLTTVPLPFAVILAGRGLQGLGVGLVPLLMGVARDRLPPDRSGATIASLSVASTVGIGVGYPIVGLVDQVAGLRAAYAVGLVLSVAALFVAWRTVPMDTPRAQPRVDVAGALLLAAGTFGVLLVIADPAVWHDPWGGAAILGASAVALAVWVVVERESASPLVDLRLLSRAPVLRANAAMLVAGVGMYLLFSLLTRYLQTPDGAGYGFGLPGVLSGAALVPFSVAGYLAGRTAPRLVGRCPDRWVFASAASCVVLASALFAMAPGSLVAVLGAMAVLGLGVGGVAAVMPRLVLVDTPRAETSSVLAINQIVRAVGFSVGSAVAGLLLAQATPSGALLPTEHGYVTAALWALPFLAVGVGALLPVRVASRARPARSPASPGS